MCCPDLIFFLVRVAVRFTLCITPYGKEPLVVIFALQRPIPIFIALQNEMKIVVLIFRLIDLLFIFKWRAMENENIDANKISFESEVENSG